MAKTKDEPQPTISTSDMANEITKMKNLWRVFERADEVAQGLTRAEGRQAELDAKSKDLEDATAKKQADYDAKAARLAAKEKELDDYEADLDQKKAAAQKQHDQDMVELSAHYNQTSISIRDKMAEDMKAEQAKIDELTAKKSDLQRDVRVLTAEIEVLMEKKAQL